MGSAGSVEAGDVPAASTTCNAIEKTAIVTEETGAISNIYLSETGAISNSVLKEIKEGSSQLKDASNELLQVVPSGEVREKVSELLNKVNGVLSCEQVQEATRILKESVSTLAVVSEVAIFATVGSALQQASEMTPEVVHIIGESLTFLGTHLGPLCAAAGFLGAIIYTFELSKDQDKNVKTVMLWCTSIKDWLLLVAGRVEKSQAESTLQLFQGLREGIETLFHLIEKRGKRWRLGKMLGSSSFQRGFERAKTSVLELKNALRDFLDQEALDLQEQQLGSIADATLELSAKLDTMDEQLAEIRSILQDQQQQKQNNTAVNLSMDEESQIYTSIALAAGNTTASDSVKFKDFVIAFECFFLGGQDMAFQTKRGLKYAIDREGKNIVTQLTFAKFFRKWKETNLPIQDHLANLAESAPPTFYAQAKSVAVPAATEAAKTAAATFDSAVKKAEQLGCTNAVQAASAIGGKLVTNKFFGGKEKKVIRINRLLVLKKDGYHNGDTK